MFDLSNFPHISTILSDSPQSIISTHTHTHTHIRIYIFGALASVFEKSASELNQKLLKCKQTIQIATFNVRTLNRIGQLPELTASAIEYNIDIICVQEH